MKKLLLAILSGVLFSLAWTQLGLAWSLFIAFIPLFIIEEELFQDKENNKSKHAFYYAYIAFFTWNLISTWWVSNSTIFGGITAVVLNSLWYALLFWLFHFIKRRSGKHTGYSALFFIWLAFESIYINGEISWVWLILGNGFANNTELIQWYEYTGALGGSAWILLVNILLFNFIQHLKNYKTIYGQYIFSIIMIALFISPIILSKIILSNYVEKKEPISFSIVQPNIDPYKEKFTGMSQSKQLEKMLKLIESKGDSNADFFLLPETAISRVLENDFFASESINEIDNFMKNYPNSNIILGATTRYIYEDGSGTKTSKIYPPNPSMNYDVFNTAIQMSANEALQKYHKSKLVIGVEMTPYPFIFDFILDNNIIDLGGSTSNLGTQERRSVFKNRKNKAAVGPIVCYESIYGDFVTDYIKEGANVLFIITNDAWWGETAGYKQHLSFAKLRAIENRRSIVRCANTGVSAIINQKGEIEEQTQYWVEDVLNGTVNLNSEKTYFSINGDFIGRIAKFISFLLLLSVFVGLLRKK